MKLNNSNVNFSAIVSISEKINKEEINNNVVFLKLQRGINAVTEIDLTEVSKNIDFNSKELQYYPANLGLEKLRKSILNEYFCDHDSKDYNKISVIPGSMSGLDIILQTLNIDNVIFPKFYWGSYSKIATIRHKNFSFYNNILDLDLSDLNSSTCIFVCDPLNPTGEKINDEKLLFKLQQINDTGCVIVFDSPYRKLFEDTEYIKHDIVSQLSKLNNVIIAESFSKWIGLSGIRLGFIWSINEDFNKELNIRMLYQYNGVSTIPQLLVNELLTTKEGKIAIHNFRKTTTDNIKQNILYLKENNLLVNEIYNDAVPIGIFAVINLTEDFLFKNKIGAVGMDKFVHYDKDYWSAYSRICVSVPSNMFKEYFDKIK